MDAQTVIARRVALELRDGMLVNLGIGIPTLVANYVPPGMHVFFQSENGLIGTGPVPEEGMVGAVPHRCRRPAGERAARRRHLRQRDVVRADSRTPRRHDGARRAAGRRGRTSRELDDPRQDGARHGRRDGSGHRRQARGDRDAAQRQGQAQDHQALHAAADLAARGRSGRHRAGGDLVRRRAADAARDRSRRLGERCAGGHRSEARRARPGAAR